jgi:hypothetical protein
MKLVESKSEFTLDVCFNRVVIQTVAIWTLYGLYGQFCFEGGRYQNY